MFPPYRERESQEEQLEHVQMPFLKNRTNIKTHYHLALEKYRLLQRESSL